MLVKVAEEEDREIGERGSDAAKRFSDRQTALQEKRRAGLWEMKYEEACKAKIPRRSAGRILAKNTGSVRNNLIEAKLFGSKAMGKDEPDSDIDVLAVVKDRKLGLEDEVLVIAFDVNLAHDVYISPRVVDRSILDDPMPVDKKPTWKMEQGKIEEAEIDRLEKRRKLSGYRLAEGERRFHFRLSSDNLGLSGRLDLLIDSPQGLFPVDFKWTTGRPHKNHIFQLCAYALLLEDYFQRPVTKGFVYLIPASDVVVFDLTDDLKEQTRTMLSEIRRMIEREEMPQPTPVRNRCADCEYRNFCGDIF